MTKAIIFDSGTLITLSMNGLLHILEEFKKTCETKFLITSAVKYEVLDKPINIKRFELEALRVKNLIDSKILELPNSLNVEDDLIKRETLRLMNIANSLITSNGKKINIISEGETSCLALSSELTKQNIENIIAIDERTTRILAEKPKNLEELMSKKLHTKIKLSSQNIEEFSKFKFIRSTELVYAAFKKGLLGIKGPKALEAALYATKFKGSSVSFDEIEILKKM